jgi:hypothetical protein
MGPAQERLKVHRRSVRLDGRAYTVLSPRPSASSRFATNQDGAMYQVLTDPVGAQFLARLCWAMAYQRHERTLTVIDSNFLVPNPFGADTSSPIVIVNSALGSLSDAVLADLQSQLPLATPSDGTVVLQTRGLDQALDDPAAFGQRSDQVARRSESHQDGWIDGDSGLWVLTAPPPVLRAWGVELSLPDGEGAGPGEVRVLASLDDHVARSIAPTNHPLPGRSPTAFIDEDG